MTLPQSIRDIADLIGLPVTMALVRHYGGSVLKVPVGKMASQTRSELIDLLGPGAAELLIKRYSGETIYISRCADAKREDRNRKIIADFDEGKSVLDLSRNYGLSNRSIYTILKLSI
ncbi:MAG: Mor transcription activator family protein [Candidatus Accumulibacter sp. UW20]|jgi:3-deoxy-D-arabino-heptulosonate 7-phosphate (DAHP) synthase class II